MNTNQRSPFQILYSQIKPQTKTTETYFVEKGFNITYKPAQKLSYQLYTNQKSNQQKIQQQLKQQVHHLSLVHPNQTINMNNQDLDLKHRQQVGTTVSPQKQNKRQMSNLQDNKINPSILQINMVT